MTDAFTPTRSEAIERGLIDHVAARPSRGRRRAWAIGLVLSGSLVGAGVSAGAFAATGMLHPVGAPGPAHPSGQPIAERADAVPAPAGVTPGTPIISLLGQAVTLSISATEIPLTPRPTGSTHARVTITAASAGSINWGTDPSGNNPSASWSANDLVGPVSRTWYDFPLDSSADMLYMNPTGLTGTVTVQFVTHVPTLLGVNASGQTFGVTGSTQGEPDLIAVGATNGASGYVYRTELEDADGTAAGREFRSPDDALEWQRKNEGVTRVIPVYESDGKTRIGEFRID